MTMVEDSVYTLKVRCWVGKEMVVPSVLLRGTGLQCKIRDLGFLCNRM